MAIATIVKSVGATGRDFSTLALWDAGGPANRVTAEEWSVTSVVGTFIQGETVTGVGLTAGKFINFDGGTSRLALGIVTGNTATVVTLTGSTSGATCVFVTKVNTGVIWRGEAYNDATFTAGITFSGTTSATVYNELTAAAGQSFQDQAGVRSNRLCIDQSLGVLIKTTAFYAHPISLAGNHGCHVSRLMAQTTSVGYTTTILAVAGADNVVVRDCIFWNGGLRCFRVESVSSSLPNLFTNCVFIMNHATATVLSCENSVVDFIACTITRSTDNSPGGSALTTNVYSKLGLVSSAVFGCTTMTNDAAKFSRTCNNNATDLSSFGFGSSNQVSVSYTQTTPFVNATAGSNMDLRAVASTSLDGTGSRDATNAPNDISLYARPASPTIGVWQLTVSSFLARSLMVNQAVKRAASF